MASRAWQSHLAGIGHARPHGLPVRRRRRLKGRTGRAEDGFGLRHARLHKGTVAEQDGRHGRTCTGRQFENALHRPTGNAQGIRCRPGPRRPPPPNRRGWYSRPRFLGACSANEDVWAKSTNTSSRRKSLAPSPAHAYDSPDSCLPQSLHGPGTHMPRTTGVPCGGLLIGTALSMRRQDQ